MLGLAGDESRDGLGELDADVVCEVMLLFAVGIDEIEGLRFRVTGVVPDVEGSGVAMVDSRGSAISGSPVTDRNSSIVPSFSDIMEILGWLVHDVTVKVGGRWHRLPQAPTLTGMKPKRGRFAGFSVMG